MRGFFAGTFFLASVVGAVAQPAASGAAQQYDVPAGAPQTVMILTRDFAPGQSAGRHIHHGVEMTLVMRGDWEMMVDGSPVHLYHVGDSFMVPRDVPHDGKNVGTSPVTIAVTYVIDKGSPMRIPVP